MNTRYLNLKLIILLFAMNYSCVMAADTKALIRQANLPSTTPEQLQVLATNSHAPVRVAVAMNRKTPVEVLDKLAKDREQDVRIAVCTNLSTTEKTYFTLAHDASEEVRSVVARFEYVSAAVLASMVADKSSDIRMEIARNWNTDIPTLTILSQDEFEEVSNMAMQTLHLREQEKEKEK